MAEGERAVPAEQRAQHPGQPVGPVEPPAEPARHELGAQPVGVQGTFAGLQQVAALVGGEEGVEAERVVPVVRVAEQGLQRGRGVQGGVERGGGRGGAHAAPFTRG